MSEMAKLQVVTSYSPLAFFYAFFKPNIALNGRLEKRPWGTQMFDVPPGDYLVEISYPWLFSAECGKNSLRLVLRPGAVARVTYRAGLIRYLPGKIRLDDPIPVARAHQRS
ncbi:MAG: hypothetical protein JWO36_1534 [Myxococcales bacterium]|nr:hypothetical protein [Myxococcales bacterium]